MLINSINAQSVAVHMHTGVDFCVHNALKLTDEHLWFQNFFRGLYPWTPC